MSASEKNGLRAALVVVVAAAAILVGAGAFYTVFGFVDKAWNGSFMDWVSTQLLDLGNLNELGVWPELVLDVTGVKFFFFQLGVCVIVAVVLACSGAAVIAGRRAAREERARAAELLRRYMAHDVPASEVFPEGWEDLALVASDVRRAGEDQARRLEDEAARRSDLVTYLAHDLKTPLTSVIGYLSLLDEVSDMPPEQRARYTGVALDKALRLERLVNEFFDITRYSLTNIELELAPVDLAFLLVQVADEFYPALSAHGNVARVTVAGVERTAEDPGEPLMVTADAARLARVFGNLVRNAIAYSDEGTPIEVRADVRDGRAVVEVSDTGVTIPSHKLRSIFDKFFRLDESRASATGGAGLGLAIAREIVELHGGSISASSEGGLTTFTVELPVVAGE
ncbi:MAG TPA: HAMP domain-containing histidine kinase [Candidatus Olsenella avicola]|uniref:sensor histidine kinase n=1 Tax=Olsenella sp. An285 TaxID=1965621 RepID=UPI0019CFAB0D|nr:HAMP domain-containing sensor histidine kinase [Olsenella sp. An285]HIY51243.1 HAMP domain-containing histidine kinase [Candidatus Olsenella avicola]